MDCKIENYSEVLTNSLKYPSNGIDVNAQPL